MSTICLNVNSVSAQITNDITANIGITDMVCNDVIGVLLANDCSYNGSDPIGTLVIFFDTPYVGPLISSGYYRPGEAPSPVINGVPQEGDGKTALGISGSITIDPGSGTDCDGDETVSFSGAVEAGEQLINGGQGQAGVESWTRIDIAIQPSSPVDAATPNGGECTYVIASNGFPAQLTIGGLPEFPTEKDVGSGLAPATQPWDGPAANPVDTVASYEVPRDGTPTGVPPQSPPANGAGNVGTTGTLTVNGRACTDTNSGGVCSGVSTFANEKGISENVLVTLTKDANDNISDGRIYFVNEFAVFVQPTVNPLSWGVTSVVNISGSCANCISATDDSFNVPQDSINNVFDVLANDSGLVDPVSVSISQNPDNGGAVNVVGSPGNQTGVMIEYSAALGFSGVEVFQYEVTDNNNATVTGTVTVNVLSGGAVDDSASVRLQQSVSINVLANDIGLMDPVTVTIAVPPTTGTASVLGSPGPASGIAIVYQDQSPIGTPGGTIDTLTYQVSDSALVDTADVSVTLDNNVPDAPDQTINLETQGIDLASATTILDISADLGGNSGDAPRTISIDAVSGAVSATESGGNISIAPTAFTGSGTVEYTVTDADNETDSGVLMVTIPNATPSLAGSSGNATNDVTPIDITLGFTPGNGSIADHVLSNTDPSLGSLGAAVVDATAATITYSYTPVAGAEGTDRFTVTLVDGDGEQTLADVQVNVQDASVDLPERFSSSLDFTTLLMVIGAAIARRRSNCQSNRN